MASRVLKSACKVWKSALARALGQLVAEHPGQGFGLRPGKSGLFEAVGKTEGVNQRLTHGLLFTTPSLVRSGCCFKLPQPVSARMSGYASLT